MFETKLFTNLCPAKFLDSKAGALIDGFRAFLGPMSAWPRWSSSFIKKITWSPRF